MMTTKTITRKPIKCIQWTGENNGEVLEFACSKLTVNTAFFWFKTSKHITEQQIKIQHGSDKYLTINKNQWLISDGTVLTTEEKERLHEES